MISGLRAAQRVLELRPGFALAHWMAATVLVGRQALAAAREHLRAGCDAQDTQTHGPGANAGFSAVGLHLLHGLVLAAVDEIDAAHVELAREVDTAPARHIYAREACANAWYARGVLHLRAGDVTRARAALESALEHLPAHPLARLALACSKKDAKGRMPGAVESAPSPGPTETALVDAAILTMQRKHADAARVCEQALSRQRTGPGAVAALASWQRDRRLRAAHRQRSQGTTTPLLPTPPTDTPDGGTPGAVAAVDPRPDHGARIDDGLEKEAA